MPDTIQQPVPVKSEAEKAFLNGEADFDSLVQSITLSPAKRSSSEPQNIAESMMSGLGAIHESMDIKGRAASGEGSALDILGRREGVPFDATNGIPAIARMTQTLAGNRDEQRMLLLRSNKNIQDVRFNRLGEPVVTVKDPDSGQIKDVLVNPIGIDSGDFAFMAANAPEIIAGMMAARGLPVSSSALKSFSAIARSSLGEAIGGAVAKGGSALASSKSVIPSAARMGVAGQSAGAFKDVAARTGLGMEVDFENIASERGTAAAFDTLFGLTGGVGGKMVTRGLTPFGKRGPLQMDAEAAQQFWKQRGVHLDLTPGEATGSRLLLRGEALLTEKPGSSMAFEGILEKRRKDIGEIQNIMLGGDPASIPHADVVGEKALTAAGAKLAPLDFAVSRETQELLKTATQEIGQSLAAATKVPAPLRQTAVGGRLFEVSELKLKDFRKRSRELYSEVYSDPALAGQGRNIDATPLAKDAKAILDEVAAVEKTVQKDTGLLDEFGKPLTQEATELQRMSSFVEGGTLSKLRQLADAEGGQVGLRDLIELRRDIDDELTRGSALGGLPERRLQDIRKVITERIRGGLNELDNSGGLLSKWENASAHYAENIKKFKDVDIVAMFKGAEERGSLGLSEVVERAIRSPDRYASYRDFFGADSQEMNMMRRVVADRLLGHVPGSSTVNASHFLGQLDAAMSGPQREIVEDALGKDVFRLQGFAKAIQQAQRKQVDVDELIGSLEKGTLTAQKVDDLINAQTKKANAFKNDLFRKIAKGNVDRETIQPSKAVDNIVFASEPKDVQEFVNLIADQPEVLDEIRQRTVLKIIHESTGGPPGREILQASGLSQFLNDPVMVKRLRPVLGEETLNMMRATRDFLNPAEDKQRSFKTAGSLVSGSQIANMERALGNPETMWSEMTKILKSFIVASAYKTGPVRSYISNTAFGPGGRIVDKAAMINAFVVAEPVVEDLIRIFGEEGGRVAALQMKQAFDSTMRQGGEIDALLEQFTTPQPTEQTQP